MIYLTRFLLKVFCPILRKRSSEKDSTNDYKNEGYIIYKGSCKGIIEVTNWILGMGSNCTVISPNELVEKVKNEIRKILDRY